jgi:2-polyprenyl-6-methoxyphenol hydroxylase-like FAD-dependent oxidoreductase
VATTETQVDPAPADGAEVEHSDVLVVGGRCGGATLAAWLARAGVSVVVADRASFPSDTLSTHVFQGGAIAALRRLGVLEEVLATGAPGVRSGRIRLGTGDGMLDAVVPMPVPGPGLPAMLCVRRVALDEILHRAAADAGATLLDGWALSDLVHEDGRVAGARMRTRAGEERTIRARVVVGADGRNSTVARLAGAASYSVLPTERFGYFAYYEGIPAGDPPIVDIVRDERLYGFGIPADARLYLACVMPPAADHAEFAADVEASWEREIARIEGIGERVAQGRRVGRPRGLRPVDTFLREAAGPGWVLVGDAGHFKDPAPGQGIADAMRQAERLAEVIAAAGVAGGSRSAEGSGLADLDARLVAYWRWRDRDARERHEWAHAFGAAGPPPRLLVEAQRAALARADGPERFWGPSLQIGSPRRTAGPLALARAAVRGIAARRLSLAETSRDLAALARRTASYRRAR